MSSMSCLWWMWRRRIKNNNNKEMPHYVSETHNLIFVEIYENGICCEMAQIVAGSKFILDGYHNCTQLYVQDRNM